MSSIQAVGATVAGLIVLAAALWAVAWVSVLAWEIWGAGK